MHAEVETFLMEQANWPLVGWEGARVLEVGAQDVNGAVRRCIDPRQFSWVTEWHGIDLVDGPGVDYVGQAETILPVLYADGERFDVAICCEVLEHARGWREIVCGMLAVLKQGGHLVITCAAPGRPPHGASGAPEPAIDEWYCNVALHEVVNTISPWAIIRYGEQRHSWPQDTYLIASRNDRPMTAVLL